MKCGGKAPKSAEYEFQDDDDLDYEFHKSKPNRKQTSNRFSNQAWTYKTTTKSKNKKSNAKLRMIYDKIFVKIKGRKA